MASGITFEVGIHVDEETASRAVNVLEWYINDNPGLLIIQTEQPDGHTTLQLGYNANPNACPYCGQVVGQTTIHGFMTDGGKTGSTDKEDSDSEE